MSLLFLVIFFTVSLASEPIWIDFLADTGDGFGSTLTVVATLSQPMLNVSRGIVKSELVRGLLLGQNRSKPYLFIEASREEDSYLTNAGSHVIVGGDLMYPEPSLDKWEQNFVLPFTFARSRFNCSKEIKTAITEGKPKMVEWLHTDRLWTFLLEMATRTRGLPDSEDVISKVADARKLFHCDLTLPGPKLWAAMGNHDALDNGATFRRGICYRKRLHENSTIELPQHYTFFNFSENEWLFLGVDDQRTAGEGRDISLVQFDYLISAFEAHESRFASQSAIIIILHQPFWLTMPKYPGPILRELLKRTHKFTRAIISGDLHYYGHWKPEKTGGPHLIISGGGGAFLHSTLHVNETFQVDIGGGTQRYALTHGANASVGLFPSRNEMASVMIELMIFEGLWIVWIGAIVSLVSSCAIKYDGWFDTENMYLFQASIACSLLFALSDMISFTCVVVYLPCVLYVAFLVKQLCQQRLSTWVAAGLGCLLIAYKWYDSGFTTGFSHHLIGLVAMMIVVADLLLSVNADLKMRRAKKGRSAILQVEDFGRNNEMSIGIMLVLVLAGLALRSLGIWKDSAIPILFFGCICGLQALILLEYVDLQRYQNDAFLLLPVPFLVLAYWDLNQGFKITTGRFVLIMLGLICVEYLILFFLHWRSIRIECERKLLSKLGKWKLKWMMICLTWVIWVILGAYFVWHYLVGSFLLMSFFTSTGEDLFSYFAISEYKNFLRFRLDGGNLTVFPIGIMAPLHSWTCALHDATGTFFATTSKASSIFNNTILIEPPFLL